MFAKHISILALFLALADAAITDADRPQPKNTVTIHNSIYATLDDVWQNAAHDNFRSNNVFVKLPVGWSVAEDSPDARIAIQLYNFGTEYLVLRDTTLTHNLNVFKGKAVIDVENGIRSDVSSLPSRVLIKKDDPADEERAPFVTVPITNLITFNGRDYAIVDNAATQAPLEGACDNNQFYVLPDGWEVAADNEDTKAVTISARYPFKYTCKVTASGRSYGFTSNATECKSDMLVKALINNKEVVGANGRMCGALMISRKSVLPNTWTPEVNITNVYKVNTNGQEHHYAVLDNTPAEQAYLSNTGKDVCDNCCQNVALKIPMGWEIAKDNMPGYRDAAGMPWGTYCSGMAFDGKFCDYAHISTTEYAAVSSCDQRVLIKRTPIDCVAGWSNWSECSTDCPSVRTRTRIDITQKAQFGGVCESIETNDSGCSKDACPAASTGAVKPTVISVTVTPTDVTTNTTSPVVGVAGAAIPSVLAAFAAVACALLF